MAPLPPARSGRGATTTAALRSLFPWYGIAPRRSHPRVIAVEADGGRVPSTLGEYKLPAME